MSWCFALLASSQSHRKQYNEKLSSVVCRCQLKTQQLLSNNRMQCAFHWLVSLTQYLHLDISWISKPHFFFSLPLEVSVGTYIVSFSRYTLPKERDPNKIFNLSFWLQMSQIHYYAWERERNLRKGVFCHRIISPPVPAPVTAEISLCVIVSVNKAFIALFLFKLFPGKPTGSSFWVWNDA